jgi:alpha-beta hydrolase superfamily lysophospholipase
MHLDGLLLDLDGRSVFVRHIAADRARSVLVLVHGSMVHSEYYLPIALRLAERGTAVVMPDLSGHGRSDGLRAHLSDYRRHVADVVGVAEWASKQFAAPLLLAGESYGGLVAFLAAAGGDTAARGLVLAAPAFALMARVPSRLVALCRKAAQVVPALRLPVTMRLVGVSHKQDLNRIAARDPLLCRQYTVGFFVELLAAQKAAFERAPDLSVPCLALLAGQDWVTDNAQSRALLAQSGGPVRIVNYPEFLHAVLSEDPERVVAEIAAFADQVVAGVQPAVARRPVGI